MRPCTHEFSIRRSCPQSWSIVNHSLPPVNTHTDVKSFESFLIYTGHTTPRIIKNNNTEYPYWKGLKNRCAMDKWLLSLSKHRGSVPIYTPPLFKWRSLICQFDKTEEQIKQKRKKGGYILTVIFSDSRPPYLPHHYWPSGLEYKYWPFHPKNTTKTAKQVYNNKCYSY